MLPKHLLNNDLDQLLQLFLLSKSVENFDLEYVEVTHDALIWADALDWAVDFEGGIRFAEVIKTDKFNDDTHDAWCVVLAVSKLHAKFAGGFSNPAPREGSDHQRSI